MQVQRSAATAARDGNNARSRGRLREADNCAQVQPAEGSCVAECLLFCRGTPFDVLRWVYRSAGLSFVLPVSRYA